MSFASERGAPFAFRSATAQSAVRQVEKIHIGGTVPRPSRVFQPQLLCQCFLVGRQ